MTAALSRRSPVSQPPYSDRKPCAIRDHGRHPYSLVTRRINVMDLQGRTPLHWAVAIGQPEAVKRLLRHGADPNIQDVWGHTSLHLAVLNPGMPPELMHALTTAGADVNLRNADVRFLLCSSWRLVSDTPLDRGPVRCTWLQLAMPQLRLPCCLPRLHPGSRWTSRATRPSSPHVPR